jgi:hypothetical protein
MKMALTNSKYRPHGYALWNPCTDIVPIDYVIVVFLNIGYFYNNLPVREGTEPPEVYTLPVKFVRKHYKAVKSGFDRVRTANLDLRWYKNDRGIDLIAEELGVEYPHR